jgi:protein TonB
MRRLLMALPLAILVCFGLLGLMAWMVDLNEQPIEPPATQLEFSLFAQEKDQISERRTRVLPEPPEPTPHAPEPTVAPQEVMPQTLETPSIEPLPELKMDLAVSGISIAIPALPTKAPQPTAQPLTVLPAVEPSPVAQNQQVMPIYRAEPEYPRKALQRRIEGYVVVNFDIDSDGRTTHIRVIESKPNRIFDREAVTAISRWKYQPKVVNGQPISQLDQKVKLEFMLSK